MNSTLINSIGFEAVLNARDAIAQRIAQAHELLQSAQRIATQNNLGFVCAKSEHEFMNMKDFFRPGGDQEAIKLTDKAAWEQLLKRSHVMDLMSAKRKQEWRTSLAKGECPPFTEQAIRGTFNSLYESRDHMLETSVVECFESLHKGYASNGVSGFTSRIVLEYVSDLYCGGLPGNSTCDQIDDLLRFMHMLDKRPIPHAHAVRNAILMSLTEGGPKIYEDDYIHIRWFKNGNGHLTFKRDDLVRGLNKMIAKHRESALPAPRNARFHSYA